MSETRWRTTNLFAGSVLPSLSAKARHKVIMKVRRSSENAMLKTVRMLRRLLRNAFLVTNRASVMIDLQREAALPALAGKLQESHYIVGVSTSPVSEIRHRLFRVRN